MEDKSTWEIVKSPDMPVMSLQDAIDRRNQLVRFVKQIMVDGTDFGIVPGTDKPTLLKPGAEKLTTFFGLTKKFIAIESEQDWTGERHGSEPFFYYWYRCQLWRGDLLIAEGDGSCNSMESKYRWRKAERVCPKCGQANIRKSKRDDSWYCWQKTGGCGATFAAEDESIANQEVGRVPNPDLADQVNTIQKMAAKRALIAATLLAVNASEFFTQDMEDLVDEEVRPQTKAKPARGEKATQDHSKGNGKTPAGFRPEFLNDHQLSEKEALSALGSNCKNVSDWLKANTGKTLVDAEAEVLAVTGKATSP